MTKLPENGIEEWKNFKQRNAVIYLDEERIEFNEPFCL
jgi:hypothetical protein